MKRYDMKSTIHMTFIVKRVIYDTDWFYFVSDFNG